MMYDHPTDMYVAGFIGSPPMNFIDCTMREDHGKALLDATHFVIDVSNLVAKMETKPIGTELIAGVRPSEIVVSEERADASSIPAEVYAIEPMGIVSVIDFKVGDHLVKAKVPASFKTAVKDKLWLSINKERLHIFDKKTEKNLL
jgi:multiple sugar transport system ATP-binding protein